MKKKLLLAALLNIIVLISYAQPVYEAGILTDPAAPKFAKLIAGGHPNYFEVLKAFHEYEKAHPERPHQKFSKQVLKEEKEGENEEEDEEEEEENTDPWRFYFQRWQSKVLAFVKSDGTIESVMDKRLQDYIKERQAALKNTVPATNRINGSNSFVASPDWRLVGPNLVAENSGNTRDYSCNMHCVDFNKTIPAIGYAGSETGYIFKTTDYGNTWNLAGAGMVFDGGGIRSIATDPANANIVYACGGSYIYKSIDGGVTWANIFFIPTGQAWNIRINPQRSLTVLIGSEAGLYQSYDGGTTFILRLNGKVKGLQYKVGDTTQVFAFSMQPKATANYPAGNYNSNIFKSYDGGKTFVNKTASLYSYNAALKYQYMATDLTVTAANANVLYAIIGCDVNDASGTRVSSGELGILKSTDAGETWSFAKGPFIKPNTLVFPWLSDIFLGEPYWQGDYNTWIIANPLNANQVIVGGLSGYKSVDQGVNWSLVSGYSGTYSTHPDHQQFFISGTDLWICNDGGILKSTDFLSSQPQVKTTGLFAAEFWGFGVGWNGDIVTGGRYHNGNAAYNNGSFPTGKFLLLGGGEASTGYVSPFGANVYHSDIGASTLPATIPGVPVAISNLTKYPNESYGWDWSKLIFHPNKTQAMFLGNGTGFWRSDDNGTSFSSLNIFPGQVLDFDICLADSNYMYIVTQDNKVWLTANGGYSFANITGSLPGGSRSIAVNPVNPQQCWMLIRGTGNVYKTVNAGASWVSVGGGNLAGKSGGDMLIQADATDPTCYIMCNNGGMYYQNSTTAGNWVASNSSLPAAHAVRSIYPFYSKNKLYFGSSGGGVWEHDLIKPTQPYANFASDIQSVHCFDTVRYYSYSIADETSGPATYTWSFPGAGSVNLANPKIPKVTYGAPGQYSASLTIKDANGNVSNTKTLTNFISRGYCYDTIAGKTLDLTPAGNPVIPLSAIPLNSNTFTITMWVKPDGLQHVFSQLLSNDVPNTRFGIGFGFPGYTDNLTLVFTSSAINYGQLSTINLVADQWNHIALTYSPNAVSIYLNGGTPWVFPKASSNTPAGFPAIDFSKAPVTVNADIHNQGGNYKGQEDEICFYNYTLTQQEIREKMHLTKNPGVETGLTGYYQFNQYNSATGVLYSAMGNGAGSIVNSGNIAVSTAPVASGTSFRIANVNAAGVYNFTGTGTSLTFPGPTLPNGEMVVSRLNSPPDSLPAGYMHLASNYWIIRNWGTNSTFNPLSALQFTGLNVSAADAASPPMLRLLKRTSNQHLNNWAAMCAAISATPGTNGTVTFGSSCNNNSFSQFLVGTIGTSPLPVKLLNFTGKKLQNMALLQWNVTQEINLSHYELQRSSNATGFEAIGVIRATNSPGYNFTDRQPLSGNNYYRLKMVDADGNFTYSDIVRLDFDNEGFITFLPNPVYTGTPLEVHNLSNEQVQVQLYLADGKLYKTFTMAAYAKMELANLPKGVIIYKVTGKNGRKYSGKQVVL